MSIAIRRLPAAMVIDILFSAPVSPLSINLNECLVNFTPLKSIALIKYNTNGDLIRLVIDNKHLPGNYRKEKIYPATAGYGKIPLCTDTQGNGFINLSIQRVASSTGIELTGLQFERLYPDAAYYFNY